MLPGCGGPSPLPCSRGRGAGVRGLESLARLDILAPTMPPHPRPLSPEYRGEGRSKAQLNSDESSSAFSSAHPQPLSPEYRGEGLPPTPLLVPKITAHPTCGRTYRESVSRPDRG